MARVEADGNAALLLDFLRHPGGGRWSMVVGGRWREPRRRTFAGWIVVRENLGLGKSLPSGLALQPEAAPTSRVSRALLPASPNDLHATGRGLPGNPKSRIFTRNFRVLPHPHCDDHAAQPSVHAYHTHR